MLALAALTACGGGRAQVPAATTGNGAATAPAPAAEVRKPAAAIGHPADDLIPRRIFFDNPERTNVQISPDGKYLAWLAAKDGVLNVWVAPAGRLDEARAVTADTSRPVRQYFWTFDKKYLLYLQDEAGNENFHIYRVDVTAPGEAVDLTPLDGVRAQVLGVSHRKPGTILVGLNDRDARYHDVYEVNVAAASRKKVFENQKYAGFVVDEDLRARFGAEPQPDGGEVISELAPAKGRKPFTQTIPAADALTTEISGFDKTGRTVYLVDSRGRDTGGLFRLDLRTGKQRLIAEDGRSDVSDVLMHPTEKTVQAVEFNYDKSRWTILDKTVQGDFDALAQAARGEFDIVSRTLDDRTWVVVFHSDIQPASFYRWDRKDKKATFLFSARPALDKLTLARMTPEIIKSRDGLDLVSYLTLPPAVDPDGGGKPNAPGPLVLLVHGGPWGRDDWGYDGEVQFLANRGYGVLQVNFRGSTGLGKKFVNAANHEWGKKMHDDLLDAVSWAVAQGIAPRDGICIMGGSYGGYATLVGVTMTPDVFACGVDIVGPSNILTLVKTIPPYWAPGISMFKARIGDWDSEDGKAALIAVSPIAHVDAIKRPLLIGQGANDPRVNKAESDQIVQAMQKKGIPVTYVLFPDEGHGFARPENQMAFYAVVEAFLSAQLGGKYQPATKEDFEGSTIQVIAGKEGVPGLPNL